MESFMIKRPFIKRRTQAASIRPGTVGYLWIVYHICAKGAIIRFSGFSCQKDKGTSNIRKIVSLGKSIARKREIRWKKLFAKAK